MAETIERGAFSLFVAHFFYFLTSFLIYFLLGRTLLVSNFGVYGILISLVSVINLVLISAMEQTVSKFVSQNPEQHNAVKKTALLLHLGISSLIFIAFVLLAPVIALLLNDVSLTPLIVLIAPLIILHPVFCLFTGALNGLKKFSEQAGLFVLYSLTKLFFIVGLVLLGFGLVGAIFGFVLSSFFMAIIGFLYPGVNLKSKTIRPGRMLGFAIPIGGLAIISNLLLSLDLFAVKALTNASVSSSLAGYYTAAGTLAKVISSLVLVIAFVLFPLVSGTTFNRNFKKARFYINNALRYAFLFTVPLATIFFAGSGEIIEFVYGSRYLPGALPLQILAIGLAAFALFSILLSIIAASGRPKTAFLIGVFVLLADIALNLLLVPGMGMEGAALATLFASCFGLAVAGWFVALKFNILPNIKSIGRILLASIPVFLVSKAFPVSGLTFPVSGLMLFFKYFIICLIYLGFLLVLRELKRFDFLVLTNVISK